MTEETVTQPLTDEAELLSKSAILEIDDLVYEIVDVPEWKGKVKVKGLTGTERDAFESSMVKGVGKAQRVTTEDIRAKLCALTIVNADGTRMFSNREVAVLGKKSAAALDRVYEVAMRLSKFSKDDVDELAKNSGSDHSDDSLSD